MARRTGSSRRQFLQTTAAFGAAFTISGTKSSGRVLGANDRVRIAVAGLNGRGSSHVGGYVGMNDVEIAYLVDPDTRTYAKHLSTIAEKKNGAKPETVQDIRRVLEDKNIDAVSIATPNHWHCLMTIWSCQAGKDVYCEKPLSHTVHEGRIAVDAARKYDRIVQHGTQRRSSKSWAQIAAAVKAGQFGPLVVSRGLCYKPRKSIGEKPVTPPPAEIDFNLWLGPAPEQPHHGNLVHYNWHWFWDFGNGDIGNQGVHQFDVARWMMPEGKLPKSVISLGGRFGYTDQGQTPNTQMSVLDYGDCKLVFEVRGLSTGDYYGNKVGNTLHFADGTTIAEGGKLYRKGSDKPEAMPKLQGEVSEQYEGNHFRNFIDVVRSRKREDLHADVLEGHLSSVPCHLSNISYRLGELVPFNPKTKALGDDAVAYETLARMEEHLGQGNGLKLDDMQYRLGKMLTFDAATERFTNSDEANKLLTRPARAPFAVPEKIS
jgi:predicted dehydrogenase